MVFVGGPPQVGKTTLSFKFLEGKRMNQIVLTIIGIAQNHRADILKDEVTSKTKTVVLDEIHKFAARRGQVKGLYDTRKSSQQILVKGSARLDYYRKGGDSLQGRYHYYRLHPFSLQELGYDNGSLEKLFRFGGFTEPLFREEETF